MEPTGGPDRDEVAGWVVAAQRGDALAMDALITLLTPYAGRLCASVAPEHAADALQEVLVVVFRRIGRLEEPAALFGWVRTIAVRESVRIAKAHRRELPTDAVRDVPSLDDVELGGDIDDVLRRLRPEQRPCWCSGTWRVWTSGRWRGSWGCGSARCGPASSGPARHSAGRGSDRRAIRRSRRANIAALRASRPGRRSRPSSEPPRKR